MGSSGPSTIGPEISYSLDTNSLNFCRFSLCPIPSQQADTAAGSSNGKGKGKSKEALIAVPGILDSEIADIYHLPSMKRLHTSINYKPKGKNLPYQDETSGKPAEGRTGLIMALHLGFDDEQLKLVMGFEDGREEVWQLQGRRGAGTTMAGDLWTQPSEGRMEETKAWSKIWDAKGHNEASKRARFCFWSDCIAHHRQSWQWPWRMTCPAHSPYRQITMWCGMIYARTPYQVAVEVARRNTPARDRSVMPL